MNKKQTIWDCKNEKLLTHCSGGKCIWVSTCTFLPGNGKLDKSKGEECDPGKAPTSNVDRKGFHGTVDANLYTKATNTWKFGSSGVFGKGSSAKGYGQESGKYKTT